MPDQINIPAILSNKREKRLRPVAERQAAIIEYRRILIALLRKIRLEVNESIIPAYSADRKLQTDSASWFASLKVVASAAVDAATDKMSGLFFRESDSHWKRFVRSIYAGVGIIMPDTVKPDNNRLLTDYVERNASLIKSLSDDAIKRIEQAVYDAKINKKSVADLSRELQRQFGILKSRADLIAEDQLASINADFNETRQTAVGIKHYRWRSRGDKRVRTLHSGIDGNVYEWGKPTGAENGLPPGKPVRCRCRAAPVILKDYPRN